MFIEARGDASELLEFAEEAFDQISMAVELWWDGALPADPALGRDVCLAAPGCHPVYQRHAVVAAVGYDGARQQRVQKGRRRALVGGLSGRDVQADRQAILIDDRVDFGTQSATRTADGVILAPFFPPAAC